MIINCPICYKPVRWNDSNIYRPFCCERCQLIDLSEWITEKKGISNFSNHLTNSKVDKNQ